MPRRPADRAGRTQRAYDETQDPPSDKREDGAGLVPETETVRDFTEETREEEVTGDETRRGDFTQTIVATSREMWRRMNFGSISSDKQLH